MRIELGKDIVAKCLDFSEKCAKSERPTEHGQKGARQRTTQEIIRDNIIGKLGEAAVQKFFASRGIHFDLDMNIYSRGEWDDFDIEYAGWHFDVKATKKIGHFFLIEWAKLQFQAHSEKLPHYFIMTRLLDDEVLQSSDSREHSVFVELAGYVDVRMLREGQKSVLTLERGQCIPGTKTRMIAKSFCIDFKHLSHDWDALINDVGSSEPFSTDSYVPPGLSKEGKQFSEPLVSKPERDFYESEGAKYSLLLSGVEASQLSIDSLEGRIKSGIKVYLFVQTANRVAYEKLSRKYERNHFVLFSSDKKVPALRIEDGKIGEFHTEFNELSKLCPAFNVEQFLAEHADNDQVIVVKASAGTGKTTVMIDRITYLLATNRSLHPGDIGMITFTNKATTSMLEKLQSRLMQLYQLTGYQRWYELLESLADIQLSTIDSYFRTLLKAEGGAIGYGTNARLQSMVYEKKKLIREILNERYIQNQPKDSLDANVISIERYVEFIFSLWEKLYAQGYFGSDIEKADFGNAVNGYKESAVINDVLSTVLVEAERRYKKLKQESNAYSLSDLKADVDALAKLSLNRVHGNKLKYLFIDEFQDTDNSQIRSLIWLQNLMKCQLFVVGDVKQSIYRFRGAEESAFDELQRLFINRNGKSSRIKTYYLNKNYRTSENIINQLNNLFSSWSSATDLLVWEADAKACISESGKYSIIPWSGKIGDNSNFSTFFIKTLREWSSSSKNVCVLTRTNLQVKMVAKWCRAAGIPCNAKLDGGFYQSDVVRDFISLLRGMLYPGDIHSIFNLLMSPYSCYTPDTKYICSLDGKQDKIRNYFDELLKNDGWHEILDQIKYQPFFTFIENLLINRNPIGRYEETLRAHGLTKEEILLNVEEYQLNLNKLLSILYQHFANDYASLLTVYEYLNLMIHTNNKENIVYDRIDNKFNNSIIDVMTVHKAKGLEFDTVLIPFTNSVFNPFRDSRYENVNDFLIDGTKKHLKIGWKYKCWIKDSFEEYVNNYYDSLREREVKAVRRDEARLLYVAMTRAKHNLIVIVPKAHDENTWSEYILTATRKKI